MVESLRDLASFAAGLRLDQIPLVVQERALVTIADLVAANLAGSRDPGLDGLANDLARRSGAATVVGTPVRTTAEGAALFNGTATVALELDEGNQFARAHPGAHVWPLLLAVAEEEGASGAEVLAAFVAGYEVAARVGAAFTLKPTIHPHGTACVVGAAAGLARLWSYSPEKLEAALHQSASLGVPALWDAALNGATVRNLFTGIALRNALTAARSVTWGITHYSAALFKVFGEVLGELTKPELLTDGLGETWFIARNYFKRHACCQYNHSTLEAVLALRRGQSIDPAEVMAVRVETYDLAARLAGPAPETTLAAKFSIPYAVAAALVLGETGPEAFGSANLYNPAIRALARRVTVAEDPALTAMLPDSRPARVTIVLLNGVKLVEECRKSRGLPDNPFTSEELEEKYRRLATPVVGLASAAAGQAAIRQLHLLPDMSALTRHLRTDLG